MKKSLIVLLMFSLFLSGCFSFEEEASSVDKDTLKLYEVNDIFQSRYIAQHDFSEKFPEDEASKNDFARTELNYLFTQELLNEGIACRDYDDRFDELKKYFPWYNYMFSVKEEISDDKRFEFDEFCYSNLTGKAIYLLKSISKGGETEYALHSYLGGGSTEEYHSVTYDEVADCSLSDWTDDDVKWACAYEKNDEATEDKYSYDLFFKTSALVEVCKGEAEEQVCEPAI